MVMGNLVCLLASEIHEATDEAAIDMQTMDPDWTSSIRPQCEPCPPNAICKPGCEAECKDDYVLVPNPFSFGGFVPLPPTCEPDSEKLRRIAILSDEAIRVLRERAADVECGEASMGKDEEAGVSEADLRQVLYDLKAVSPAEIFPACFFCVANLRPQIVGVLLTP